MKISTDKSRIQSVHKRPSILITAMAVSLAVISLSAQAGKITSIPSATVPGVQDGFGGWNLDNVVVNINGTQGAIGTVDTSWFDPSNGAYSFAVDSDHSYSTDIKDDVGTIMGYALAKDWPVGEPAGIKIVNDDLDVKDKPTNCIMSTSYLDGHFLDEADPLPVLCSGPFQSHKRYKVAMLPATVANGPGFEKSIDMVFNVEDDGSTIPRDYQVFQKINNWTGLRLTGFTIEIGTGVGTAFIRASDTLNGGAGVTNLSLSVPVAVWARANQNANFSTGLFGPIDLKHDRPAGFFDPDTRAGFIFNEYGAGKIGDASGQTDTLTSGPTLGSDYADVPPGTAAVSATANQFGNWLPNTMLPYGIFFDDDGNPDTDAELKAWYGYNPVFLTFGWMRGVADNFIKVEDTTIDTWSSNPLYSMGEIDDLVNVGLNYVVTVGDVSTFSNFTIRITPIAETVATPVPDYVGMAPSPPLVYASNDADVSLTPFPEFIPGSLLTTRVGDADRNNLVQIDTVNVNVSATGTTVIAAEPLILTELGINRGVYVANLPDKFSNVAAGTTVHVTYTDTTTDTTTPGDITVSSTAVASLPAGVLQFNPVSYTVAENDGSLLVAVERTDGSDGIVTVDYQTTYDTAIGGEDYIADTGTLTFGDTIVSQTIPVLLVNDTVAEGEESFSIVLSNAQGGGVTLGAASTATITITDTDTNVVAVVPSSSSSNGLFSFSWMTVGLVLIGLLGRARRKTS